MSDPLVYEVRVYDDGTHHWYLEGKVHRVDGPAIEYSDGSHYWYLEGKLHRVDGPAYESANGSRHWYLEGKLNRTDGPAIEYSDGSREWCLEGRYLTETEHARLTNHGNIEILDRIRNAESELAEARALLDDN